MRRFVLALGVCMAFGAHAAQEPELIPFWDSLTSTTACARASARDRSARRRW